MGYDLKLVFDASKYSQSEYYQLLVAKGGNVLYEDERTFVDLPGVVVFGFDRATESELISIYRAPRTLDGLRRLLALSEDIGFQVIDLERDVLVDSSNIDETFRNIARFYRILSDLLGASD